MPTPTLPNTFVSGTLAKSAEVNANFEALRQFIIANLIQKDASLGFTATPVGPSLDPVSANQFARKAYVDAPRYTGSRTGVATTSTGAAGSYVVLAATGWVTGTSSRVTATGAGVTILETGWYLVTATAEHFIINNTWRGVGIAVNGTVVASDPRGAGVNGTSPTCQVTKAIPLSAGDLVAVRHGHDNSIAGTVNGFLSVIGIQGTF